MADGTIIIDSKLETTNLRIQLKAQEKELVSVRKELTGQENDLAKLEAKYASLTASAREFAKEAKLSDADTDAFISSIPGAAALEEQMRSAAAAIDWTAQKEQFLTSEIEKTKQKIQELGHTAPQTAEEISENVSKATKSVSKFSRRINELVKSALIFNVLSAGLRSLTTYLGNALKSNDEFSRSLAQTKGSLLTAFQPIWQSIVPWLQALINILNRAASAFASFTSMLFGTTVGASADAAEALYDEAKAIEGVGGAAKKSSKQLAGFDEINQLTGDTTGGGGAAGGSSVDFNGLDIKQKVDELEIYLSGALLALGAILTFTGANIPLGLGLMAFGAVGLASALRLNWDTMPDGIGKALTRTLGVLGGASFAIGAILAFTSANIPLGIGLMVAGVAALGLGGSIALRWGELQDNIKEQASGIALILSGALLALGAILAFSGVKPALGIALMAAGAAGLASAIALTWDNIPETVKAKMTDIAVGVGLSLLALGAILAMSGVNIPLGIGMMLAGGAALGTAVAINWDGIYEKLTGAFDKIENWWQNTVEPFIDAAKEKLNDLLSLASSGLSGASTGFIGPQISLADSAALIENVPHLATGSVIPGGSEFLAVLGDQPRGQTNIETPLPTMIQAFKQALAEFGMNKTVILEVDKRQFAKIIFDLYGLESKRVGVKLGGST